MPNHPESTPKGRSKISLAEAAAIMDVTQWALQRLVNHHIIEPTPNERGTRLHWAPDDLIRARVALDVIEQSGFNPQNILARLANFDAEAEKAQLSASPLWQLYTSHAENLGIKLTE